MTARSEQVDVEPTPEEVEAGAQALADYQEGEGTWAWWSVGERERSGLRGEARAVLMAVRGMR